MHVDRFPSFLEVFDDYVPEDVRNVLNVPAVFVQALEFNAHWKRERPNPNYTCPSCRKAIETAPIDCLPLATAIKSNPEYTECPEETRLRQDCWEGFFSPFDKKNTPFQINGCKVGLFLMNSEEANSS
jgi:hypothetical protein